MNEQALKLFQENYSNKGLCENLDKMVKTFDKEFKKQNTVKTISYLPWAVVERIFRMQGGKIEVVEWVNQVQFDFFDLAPQEDGTFVMQQQQKHALFIHLKATWMDEVEEEFYPLFDNQSAKIIQAPDALDLNTARQRGMVRLIARVSGIGLWIFEQQDNQFGDENPNNTGEKIVIKDKDENPEGPKEGTPQPEKPQPEEPKPEPKPEEPKKRRTKKDIDKDNHDAALAEAVHAETKPGDGQVSVTEPQAPNEPVVKEPEPKKPETAKPEETPKPGFMQAFLAGAAVQPPAKEEPVKEGFEEKKDFGPDTEEYANALLALRTKIRGGDEKTRAKAKEFVSSKGKEVLSSLTYQEIQELTKQL